MEFRRVLFRSACGARTGATFPSFVMTYPEVSFILAEAAERGWVTTAGTAAALYNQGIQASMAQWGVTDATAINAYLADTAIVYKGGTPGLRQIALQKWIALYTNGVQAWAEWRRTCVPETLVPGPDAVHNTPPPPHHHSTPHPPPTPTNPPPPPPPHPPPPPP